MKQTPERGNARRAITTALMAPNNLFGFALVATAELTTSLVADGSGDRLDAVLCAMQAGWAWLRRDDNYGLPEQVDGLEGWIAMVPDR